MVKLKKNTGSRSKNSGFSSKVTAIHTADSVTVDFNLANMEIQLPTFFKIDKLEWNNKNKDEKEEKDRISQYEEQTE